MKALIEVRDRCREATGLDLNVLSGGNSANLPLLASGEMPREINHFRIGEAIVLGRNVIDRSPWPGTRQDTFRMVAEVVEVERKPSMPIGDRGQDAFGDTPEFEDRGVQPARHLQPRPAGLSSSTASSRSCRASRSSAGRSDHLILDVEDAEENVKVGDELAFWPGYGALLALEHEPLRPEGRDPRMSLLYATHARVHLGNIRDNLRAIRAAVGPERKVLVAVKANGYGHGAVEVSRMAEATGTADWLGVATVPEGLQLREAGLGLPILKLGPTFPWEMRAASRPGITLAVCSREEAEALAEAAREADRPASVHLKVDTGMGRVGVSRRPRLPRWRASSSALPGVVLEGVFTHLPVSDAADAAYTREQILRFRDDRRGSSRRPPGAGSSSTARTPGPSSATSPPGSTWCGPESWSTASVPTPRRPPRSR